MTPLYVQEFSTTGSIPAFTYRGDGKGAAGG
jgi:hypothetical protein